MVHLTDENDIAIYDIIGAAMEVHAELKSGLLEAVYAEALTIELENRAIEFVDPTLRQQIEDAVHGKSVRLVRIQSTCATGPNEATQPRMTYDDFKRKNPAEIVQDIYKKQCGEEMPAHLLEKLNEIIKEIHNEDIGNKGI